MGMLGLQESGKAGGGLGNGLPQLPQVGKGKYRRMDEELVHEGEEEAAGISPRGVASRKASTRKYVFACAVFASLNSVLLGYGKARSNPLTVSFGLPLLSVSLRGGGVPPDPIGVLENFR